MTKILVENLKYRYPQTDSLALDDISFSVEEGEFIGLIGQNNAGKSTLCQALAGLVPHFYKGAYGGRVVVDGMEVRHTSISELCSKVGLVFQNPFTQVSGSKRTVYEEISFGLENMGLDRAEMIRRVDSASKLMRLTSVHNKNPFELSGGQMQRMAIASVLAMRPNIIVLDEPTSQLDPQGSREVFQAISDLSRQGMSIVMTEHKIEKIAEYCHKVIVLKEGRLLDFDTPRKIFSRHDFETLGIPQPVYTRVCKALNAKPPLSPCYPVTLEEAYTGLKLSVHKPGVCQDLEN